MSALHAVRDGAAVAVELVALLFSAPQMAGAHDTRRAPLSAVVAQPPRTANDTARELHAMHSALEGRLLGTLNDIRAVELGRGEGRVDPIDAGPDGDCGGDDDDAHAGHARATLDEAIADVTRLWHGQHATIVVEAIDKLYEPAVAYRFEPPHPLPVASQFVLLNHPDGVMLMVIPPREAVGQAVLTLRPGRGPTTRVALGSVDTRPVAYVVPLAIAPDALLGGSVELEIIDRARITWTTLTAAPTTEPAAVVAHGASR